MQKVERRAKCDAKIVVAECLTDHISRWRDFSVIVLLHQAEDSLLSLLVRNWSEIIHCQRRAYNKLSWHLQGFSVLHGGWNNCTCVWNSEVNAKIQKLTISFKRKINAKDDELTGLKFEHVLQCSHSMELQGGSHYPN